MIQATGTTTEGTQPAGNAASPMSSAIGKDDFLKLLVGQLKNQNPMSPMGDQDFIGQMTAISTLEQVTNLAATTAELKQASEVDQALGLIGRNVSYVGPDGAPAEGVVEKVTFDGGGPSLTIGGVAGIRPAAVGEVR